MPKIKVGDLKKICFLNKKCKISLLWNIGSEARRWSKKQKVMQVTKENFFSLRLGSFGQNGSIFTEQRGSEAGQGAAIKAAPLTAGHKTFPLTKKTLNMEKIKQIISHTFL